MSLGGRAVDKFSPITALTYVTTNPLDLVPLSGQDESFGKAGAESWPPVWAPSRRHQQRLNWAGAGGGSRTGLCCHFARAIRRLWLWPCGP
eukprot:COSAG06_NODE_258_length_18940_cov_15.039648_22_plen_91_part_00